MPFEKIKQLARVAKSKTKLPAQLIERAKDVEEPAAKLREEVDIMLYRGAPDHSDGPKRSLVLVAGKRLIGAIEEKIGRLRPAATEEGALALATDAEVVDFALADCLSGIQEAEDHEMGPVNGGEGAVTGLSKGKAPGREIWPVTPPSVASILRSIHPIVQGLVQPASSFAKLVSSSVREAESARFRRLRCDGAKTEAFSRVLRRWHGGVDSELNCFGAQREGRNA